MVPGQDAEIYCFGGYELDLGLRELRQGDDVCPIEPQAFDLLAYLIANRDRIVAHSDALLPDIRWDGTRRKSAYLSKDA